MKKIRVILSSPIPLEGGSTTYRINKKQARKWIKLGGVINYCQHDTVRLLGIRPAVTRRECRTFDEALVIKPRGRLEFGVEYTAEAIEDIGYDIYLIFHFTSFMWGEACYVDLQSTPLVPDEVDDQLVLGYDKGGRQLFGVTLGRYLK